MLISMKDSHLFHQFMAGMPQLTSPARICLLSLHRPPVSIPRGLFFLVKAIGLVQVNAKLIPCLFPSRNVAGQWNQVFVQPLPEEEVTVRQDQDPRVSQL